MNKHLMRYIMKRQGDERRGRDNRDMRDIRRDYEDYEDGQNWDDRDNRDGRRGVRGRGRRDRRDSRDSRDNRDYGDDADYNDYEDYNDHEEHQRLRLKKSDMHHWKHKMENADGTTGEHFDMQQVMHAAEKIGINFKEYSEKEFCLAMNMMYSDYCRSIKKFVSPDKEAVFCAELARDFLEDDDGPEPSEKLALYYYCIVSCDEV